MTLLLAAWAFALLSAASHIARSDFGWGFWLNAALVVVIPLIGIAAEREGHPR